MTRKYEKLAPQLAGWLDDNVPADLTVFDFPAAVPGMVPYKRLGMVRVWRVMGTRRFMAQPTSNRICFNVTPLKRRGSAQKGTIWERMTLSPKERITNYARQDSNLQPAD